MKSQKRPFLRAKPSSPARRGVRREQEAKRSPETAFTLFFKLHCYYFVSLSLSNVGEFCSLTAVYYSGSGRFFCDGCEKSAVALSGGRQKYEKKILLDLQDSSLHTQPHRITDWYQAIRQTAHCCHIFLRSKTLELNANLRVKPAIASLAV